MSNVEVLIEARDLCKYYPVKAKKIFEKNKKVRAVEKLNLSIRKGSTFGLVGESGCGKSTTGQMLSEIVSATQGEILYQDKPLREMNRMERAAVRKKIQMVFQDSYSSLNPRKQIFQILSEPMLYHSLADKHTVHKKAEHLMELVGLPLSALDRYPYEFSGGQRQRIGIAKALSLEPKLLICDEPVSALDVSIQAQILNLLKSLQKELDLTCIFIGHGLGAVNYVSRRIAVMYLGKLVETGESSELFEHPVHPYTRTLLGAVPIPDPRKREENWGETSEGTAYEPSITGAEDKGCPFKDRCFRKRPECSSAEVPLRPVRPGSTHLAACSPAVLEVKRNE